jgi:hypothetical protein
MNAPLPTPEHFQLDGAVAYYRPVGQVSLDQTVKLVSAAILFARDRKISRLLIDATQLTGAPVPTTLEHFSMAQQLARDAQCAVKVAMVAKPELIDPRKFGITVARNRGLIADIFPSEAEALAWLLAPGGV